MRKKRHIGAFTMSRRGREPLLVTLALCQYYYSTEKLTHEKEEAEKRFTKEQLEREGLEEQICAMQVFFTFFYAAFSVNVAHSSLFIF